MARVPECDSPDPADLEAMGITAEAFELEMIEAAVRTRLDWPQDRRAVAARYDRETGRVVIDFANRTQFSFPAEMGQGLAGASPDDLMEIEIVPSGFGLHWEKLDADLDINALLAGVFGGRSWMAKQMGQAGGKIKSVAKTAAVRENGKKGGRPRKQSA